MAKLKLQNSEIEKLSNASQYNFPKYATQFINLINSNAQGTRPNVVGQMSELIQEFDGNTLDEWITWYTERNPKAVANATERIFATYEKMRDAFNAIDKQMIENWVKDLVYTKTFCGLKFQGAIIASIAKELGKTWRLANIEEESKGIDGYIDDKPLQIKADTYKLESRLSEKIDVPIVYYSKKKDGISINYNPTDF